MIFILTSCFGGCGYWRRRQIMLAQTRTFGSLPPGGPGGGLRSFSARNAGRFTTGSAIPVPIFANYLGEYVVSDFRTKSIVREVRLQLFD